MHPTRVEQCDQAIEALRHERKLVGEVVSAMTRLECYYRGNSPERAQELMKLKNQWMVRPLVGAKMEGFNHG